METSRRGRIPIHKPSNLKPNEYFGFKNTKHTNANVLFSKVGLNNPIVSDLYNIKGVKYDPAINKGDLNSALGGKFADRM